MADQEEKAADLLRVMMPLAVSIRIMHWLSLPEENRPKPDDPILCLECGGRGNGCAVCGDHLHLPRKEAYASFIAAHGDRLMYKGKKGEAAKAFNVMADCLALLSFAPGGVTVLGMHFDAADYVQHTRIVHKTEPEVPLMVKGEE